MVNCAISCLQGATRVDKRFLNHLTDYLGEDPYKEWADDVSNAEDWQVGANNNLQHISESCMRCSDSG